MTDEEKRLQDTAVEKVEEKTESTATKVQDNLGYTNPYDSQIKDLYDKITNRDPFEFTYNPSTDAMYNAYVDRYMSLGKQAMRDTMGQAAGLTGGYGNSYAQGVGQRAYDTYLQGANDKLAEFSDRAYELSYGQYQDEGARLNQQYGMLWDMADDDFAKYQDRVARQQAEYEKVAALITAAGYMPTDEELAKSGMTKEAAKMLQYQWAATYPQLGYNKGILSADDYFAITGAWPIGYEDPNAMGGGGWGPALNINPYGSGSGNSLGATYKNYAEGNWAPTPGVVLEHNRIKER